ncbi:BMC domain-containing protein [Halanaerobium congolense]|jgi:microcompartment protein CcmL/EutN|uniref:BMC domain-containing protein n=1 Tax=Halanaerobium congolense TaxID=54121 RepID=A0A1G6KII9_9FIRM|nr:BMC domain-containing protein [Halanaerobium congolense]PXV62565.1 BMC domain-containing protein [Halanaerobium congolense]SDC30136.1 BMC domain-containing protein [Halanaerobium congolense]
MAREAVGFIEVYGYSPAILAADTALKTADVDLTAIETTRGKAGSPGLVVLVKLRGSVDAVKAAVEAGAEKAANYTEVIASNVIARPDSSLASVVDYSNVK